MEQQDRIMDGDLQTLGLQSILKMLALSGKTGKLFVRSGSETISISLSHGQIVALHEEGGMRTDLLAMLCLIGKLDPPRAQAIRDMAQGDMQLALSMLVERGWMSGAEMQQRLEFAVTQSISHALRWVNGRFEFHRHMVPVGSKMQPLDVDSVLLEALRQADEWEEIGNETVPYLAQLTRTTVARWLPEVNNDVRQLGLSQESIEVLCLANGEVTLQAAALGLMMPEARVARIIARLLELRLVEVVDTELEGKLQRDLANIIIKSQHTLAKHHQTSLADQLLLGLILTLSECINGLLVHHGLYARSLRGRGQLQTGEVVRYLERRFGPQLQQLTRQQFPILETITFAHGQLDCNDILTLNKVVKGEQLEEFYWEAVQGLATFLQMIFEVLLRDEVGNSHTGRQLNLAWKVFLGEVDGDIQRYQVYRAQRNIQLGRGRESGTSKAPAVQSPSFGVLQNGDGVRRGEMPGNGGNPFWPSDPQRRSI
jgi:hypothetical protein